MHDTLNTCWITAILLNLIALVIQIEGAVVSEAH